jgi:hypothetical protein
MIAATYRELPARSRVGNIPLVADARLFSLVDQLKQIEKERDALLDRLSVEEGDEIEAAAKKACDAARTIYAQIAAIKPTTGAGVLCQLELAAKGWLAPSTVPIAMAALREIAGRPRPFKIGRLPPVPTATGLERNADMGQPAPTPF